MSWKVISKPAKQILQLLLHKKYIKDFGQELFDTRGIGMIVWGGEWVDLSYLICPDQWGARLSWENKSFWDDNHNLNDGVNWMNEIVI